MMISDTRTPGTAIRIRALNPIERAFTFLNDAMTFCTVCVLRLSGAPSFAAMRIVLDELQSRHALLQSEVVKVKDGYDFVLNPEIRPIRMLSVQRSDEETWREIAENELNTKFDRSGPLMRCAYVMDAPRGSGELIVCFHHALIDGISARLLLHEILCLAGGIPLPAPQKKTVLHKLPARAMGFSFFKGVLDMMGRELRGELRYRKEGAAARVPLHSRNGILEFRLGEATTEKLVRWVEREGLSLNSVLLAALTQSVIACRYRGRERGLARVVSFANLRSALIPPVTDTELGSFVTMVRLVVPFAQDQPVAGLAGQIGRALFRASRRREVLMMFRMSGYLFRMTMRMKNQRMGIAALSYIGTLELEREYGNIRLDDVRAFITNNRFGPALPAFAKILHGRLGIDFTYLTAETDLGDALHMMHDVRASLEHLAEIV